MLKIEYGRRQFVQRAGGYGLACIATVSGLAALSGCNGKQEAEPAKTQSPEAQDPPGQYKSAIDAAREAADPCNDTSSLGQDALATREAFEYESQSADATELCRTCEFWGPAPAGDLCGTCTIVKGPIHPLGTCISWEEKSNT